jgi:hypothetical protein
MGLREKSIPPDLEMSNFFDELCPGLTKTEGRQAVYELRAISYELT